MWSIQITTTQKFLQIYLKNKRHNRGVKVFAARSKAKAKPQKRETVELPSTGPMNERSGLTLNQRNPSLCVRGLEESNQSSST